MFGEIGTKKDEFAHKDIGQGHPSIIDSKSFKDTYSVQWLKHFKESHSAYCAKWCKNVKIRAKMGKFDLEDIGQGHSLEIGSKGVP